MTRLAMTWPAVRATLLAIVIGYNGLLAIPTPNPQTVQSLRRPNAQAELDALLPWARRLGVAEDAAGLTAWAAEWSQRVDGWHRALARPWGPIYALARTGQRWKLFSTPSPYAHRFMVLARRADGEWVRLFARHDPDHQWLGEVLNYRRIRTIYEAASRDPQPMFKRLARWIADRAFAFDPSIEAVRVGQTRWRVGSPRDRSEPAWIGGLVFYRGAP